MLLIQYIHQPDVEITAGFGHETNAVDKAGSFPEDIYKHYHIIKLPVIIVIACTASMFTLTCNQLLLLA